MRRTLPIGLLLSTDGTYRRMARHALAGARDALAEINADPQLDFQLAATHCNPRGELRPLRRGNRRADAAGRAAPVRHHHLGQPQGNHSRPGTAGRGCSGMGCPYEGFESSESVLYLGACPNQTLVPLLRYALATFGLRARLPDRLELRVGLGEQPDRPRGAGAGRRPGARREVRAPGRHRLRRGDSHAHGPGALVRAEQPGGRVLLRLPARAGRRLRAGRHPPAGAQLQPHRGGAGRGRRAAEPGACCPAVRSSRACMPNSAGASNWCTGSTAARTTTPAPTWRCTPSPRPCSTPAATRPR